MGSHQSSRRTSGGAETFQHPAGDPQSQKTGLSVLHQALPCLKVFDQKNIKFQSAFILKHRKHLSSNSTGALLPQPGACPRRTGFHMSMSEPLDAYCVPSTVLGVSPALTHLMLTLKLWRGHTHTTRNLGWLRNSYKVNNWYTTMEAINPVCPTPKSKL